VTTPRDETMVAASDAPYTSAGGDLPLMVHVTAPATLPAGYTFEAEINGDPAKLFTCEVVCVECRCECTWRESACGCFCFADVFYDRSTMGSTPWNRLLVLRRLFLRDADIFVACHVLTSIARRWRRRRPSVLGSAFKEL
jgi:hypothetical protein